MEYIVIIIFLMIVIVILRKLFGFNKKEIEQIAKNEKLDNIVSKFPDNIEICKDYLKMLKNDKVKIEEDKNATNSLYIAISNKILIADLKESYTRIQTIAHECLHSIQDRKLLLFNFFYSNIYIIYFLMIVILGILKFLPNKMIFLIILIIGGFIYYFIRSYLENDAMIKARFLAKEYIEQKKLISKEEIDEIVKGFDELNNIGIKAINYKLFLNTIIKVIIFCLICIIR